MNNKEIINLLKNNQHEFHPVVPFDPVKDKLLSLDFTANNQELTGDILSDTTKFTSYINNKLTGADAKYGIGGYAEHRTLYSISKLFDADENWGPSHDDSIWVSTSGANLIQSGGSVKWYYT